MQFFLNLFIFTDALHVSGGSCAHHQEHTIVHTASGSQPILLLAAVAASSSIGWLPEAVCTIVFSWWWAQEPPETCRASVKINKFNKNFILLAVTCNYITMRGHMNIKQYVTCLCCKLTDKISEQFELSFGGADMCLWYDWMGKWFAWERQDMNRLIEFLWQNTL